MIPEAVLGSKRPFEEKDAETDGSKKARVDHPEYKDSIDHRFLIASSQVGTIIGKGGANVKRIREESGAGISILKQADDKLLQERVMLVRGKPDQIADAARIIADILIEAEKNRDKTGLGKPVDAVCLKLMVHMAQSGVILGKAGAHVKATALETGARIQLSNEALPNSTDKTVTITGSPDVIGKALNRIILQIQGNHPKGVHTHIPYIPTPGGASVAGGAATLAQAPANNRMPYYAAPSVNPSTVIPIHVAAVAPAPALPGTGAKISQKLSIPAVCVGSIIGKSGSIIRDLRQRSGCGISINEPEPDKPLERIVLVTGHESNILSAIALIRTIVENFKP